MAGHVRINVSSNAQKSEVGTLEDAGVVVRNKNTLPLLQDNGCNINCLVETQISDSFFFLFGRNGSTLCPTTVFCGIQNSPPKSVSIREKQCR